MNEEKNLEWVQAKKALLLDFLDHYKQTSGVVPDVLQQLDVCKWEEETLAHLPLEAIGISSDELSTALQRDYEYVSYSLSVMPRHDTQLSARASAITTSGASVLFSLIARIGQINLPSTLAFACKYTADYQELQISQERRQAVRAMTASSGSPNTLERFDRASRACDAAIAEMGEPTAAAMEVRTSLDGMKGDLFQNARQHQREKMIWEIMAERLAIGKPGGVESQEVLRQKTVFSTLYNRLSDIGKDRNHHKDCDIAGLWAQVLDHAFAVLQLTGASEHSHEAE